MQLSELLQELRQGILGDRTDRVSGTADYLWTDETLVRYINEAQRRFARKSLILRDGSTEIVTVVTLVAGQIEYVLHESVIAVISARMMTQTTDLNRVGHSLLSGYRAPASAMIDPGYYSGLPDGATVAYSTDEELDPDANGSLSRVTLRVYPKPSVQQDGLTVRLRVVRNPIVRFSVDDLDVYPEIPEDHHLEMLDWAAYLALRIVDDDAGAPARAREFQSNFEAHVQAARITAMRKLFAPMPWGFGRGGYSWDN